MRKPLTSILGVAGIYVAIGLLTVFLAQATPSPNIRVIVRVSSWLVSAAVFLGQILHERRAGETVFKAAVHCAAPVALATAILALVGIAHQFNAGTLRPGMAAAFVVWPLLTGTVSFLVSSLAVAVLRRLGRAAA